MATWSEQGGPDELAPIPPCAYLTNFSEEPDFVRRSNIFAYSEALAKWPNKYKPVVGTDGKPIKELPSMAPPASANAVTTVVSMKRSEAPEITTVPSNAEMRVIQIMETFKQLEPGDLKLNNTPKWEVVRERSGITDLTAAEVKELWAKHQEAQK